MKDAKLSMEELVIEYENTLVYDQEGNLIAQLSGDENREIIKITEMSPYLPKAFIAIEDERFYDHQGIDLKRTAAATVKYGLSKIGIGSASYGGSTITQQLVKNLTKEDDRSWERKAKEMARAHYIEKELSKDQILELYLNLIFLGGNTYGVEVASNYYFSKGAQELSLAECAFLAGINNSPNSYSPFNTENTSNIEKIKTRAKVVLTKMQEVGYINNEEYNNAVSEVDAGLKFQKGQIRQIIYSYHTEAAINEIKSELLAMHPDWSNDYVDLYVKSGGLKIYTTQDTAMQKILEEEMASEDYTLESKTSVDGDGNPVKAQAAMIIMDHKTGQVKAVNGGLGEKTSSFGLNRATQSKRQTGSSMKPLAVVAPGIESGVFTAATVYDDVPSGGALSGFKNYGYSNKGLITLRYAVADSQNIPMLKGMQALGVENSVAFLKTLGFKYMDEENANITYALGSFDATPLEMVAAYSAVANNGIYIEPTFYTKVVDSTGNTILETKQERRTVMSEAAAYVTKEVLTQPIKSGTSTACGISGMSVGAKTGTTNDDFDRWFCGFTPYYTAATWYGYDKPETVNWSGYNPAALIWRGTMREIHKDLKSAKFSETKPSGVVTAVVCKNSGLLATELCKQDPRGDQSYTEYFVKGTVPKEECTCHVEATICLDTGLLANASCTNVEKTIYITRPDWETNTSWQKAKDKDYMLTIKDVCTLHTDGLAPVITLNGSANIELKINEEYQEKGATAMDLVDGDLTANITVSGEVNTKVAGTYIVTYKVKDLAGNETAAIRTVVVKEDKPDQKPVITLNGNANIELKVNDKYEEKGAKASDDKDGDITSKIEISGKVNTSVEGTYKVTYKVKDSAGNEAVAVRTIVVKKQEEQEKPQNPQEQIKPNEPQKPSESTNTISPSEPTEPQEPSEQ